MEQRTIFLLSLGIAQQKDKRQQPQAAVMDILVSQKKRNPPPWVWSNTAPCCPGRCLHPWRYSELDCTEPQ